MQGPSSAGAVDFRVVILCSRGSRMAELKLLCAAPWPAAMVHVRLVKWCRDVQNEAKEACTLRKLGWPVL